MNLSQISQEILKSLQVNKKKIHTFFINSNKDFGTRYCFIDNLLPDEIALKIAENFPKITKMRLLNSHREKKYTSKNFKSFNKLIYDTALAFQQKEIINTISEITNIPNLENDISFYAGGLSSMVKGNFLNPHLDNSHNYDLTHYRNLNLLYYVTPDWNESDGSHLHLWDSKVERNKIILSKFNRLVLMETNDKSWHSVSVCENKYLARNCISNYYFSKKSVSGYEYSNVTMFSALPHQKYMRIFCKLDNHIRQSLRVFFKKGLSKKDLNTN